MIGKEANIRTEQKSSHWKARLTIAMGTVAVIAAALVARNLGGPGEAVAQTAPAAPPANAAPNNPAASPANPTPSATLPPAATTKLNVVATVNGQPITRQQLAHECQRRYGTEVLETIVNKHVIWQACKRRNITITEEHVAEEIQRIAAKFGLSVDRWLGMLKQERDILPDQYRREIVWPTLALRRLAADRIVVTQEEMTKAWQSEYGPKVKARMITVATREKADRVQAQAAAKPDAFGDLAKQHSEDPSSASTRGLIPPIRMHMGNPELERAAFTLKKGQVSNVIPVGNQFIILKCEQQIPESKPAPELEKKIVEQLGDRIRDNKLRTASAQLFQQLQTEARVVNVYNDPNLARQYPGVAAIINGQQITIRQLAEQCITRYGKDVLTGEINRKLLLQTLASRGKTVDKVSIDKEIARAAESYGYLTPNGQPDINKWLESVTEGDRDTVDLYVRDAVWPTVALKSLVGEKVDVTDEDIRKGFESNYGPRAKVLAIVLGNMRQAHRVWESARATSTDKHFGVLAAEYSIEPVSRENNGQVPPIRRWGGQTHMEEEAFKLKAGELSGIIAIGDKFVILRSQGFTEPVVKTMDADVQRELVRDLHEKKLRVEMANEFEKIKKNAQIDNYLAGTSQSAKTASRAANLPNRLFAPRR